MAVPPGPVSIFGAGVVLCARMTAGAIKNIPLKNNSKATSFLELLPFILPIPPLIRVCMISACVLTLSNAHAIVTTQECLFKTH